MGLCGLVSKLLGVAARVHFSLSETLLSRKKDADAGSLRADAYYDSAAAEVGNPGGVVSISLPRAVGGVSWFLW